MTGSAPPDVTVDYTAAWTHVSHGDELTVWAPRAAEEVWRRTGGPFSRLDVERLGAKLAVVAEVALATDCTGAFFLVPEPGRGPIAAVRLNALRYEPGTPVDDLVEQLLLPGEVQLFPPNVEHLGEPGPRRVRLRQRAFSEETRAVSDYLSWLLPFDGTAWVLSASFPDHRVADRWLPELDALAAAVRVARVGA